jgi:Amt family ammonium transporter
MYTGVKRLFRHAVGPGSWLDAGGADEGDDTRLLHSDWFFQMVFCATTASIVSGTLAERIKLWPFLIFVSS